MAILICPTCGKTVELEKYRDAANRPFCCKRCQLVDLARWLNEEYRIEFPCGPRQQGGPAPCGPEFPAEL